MIFKYQIGQSVYLKTDDEQYERIVTEIWIRPTGTQYYLMQGTFGSWHYDFEITKEKDPLKKLNLKSE